MKKAFSLVELSIVLVILGLLVGGVLSGQSLIRAAELRAVSTEYEKFLTAGGTFRDKYFGVPGDLINATSFWGTAAVCPGVAADARPTAATCNGNGDSRIVHLGGTANEMYNVWQHLANAGLIEGSYTGVTSSAVNYYDYGSVIGANIPASKLNQAGWFTQNQNTIAISSLFFIEGDYINPLFFGGYQGVSDFPRSGILKPEEAWNIDTKLDDGKAGSGNIVSYETNSTCYLLADGSVGSTSNSVARNDVIYNLVSNNKACALIFKKGF